MLEATGGAAGLTGKEIRKLSSDLQDVTNFEDDATTSAAAVLATFKQIKGDQFKEAIGLAQDLSVVMESDLKSSVMQVGKALNDPIKGMTALSRAGVSFTEQQKQQIETLQRSGDLLGAQKIILQELQTEVGGAAKAMADPLTQLDNAFSEVKETLGGALLPTANAFATVLKNTLNGAVDESGESIAAWGENAANQIDVIGATATAVGGLADAFFLLKESVLGHKLPNLEHTGKQLRRIQMAGGIKEGAAGQKQLEHLRGAFAADLARENALPSAKLGKFFEEMRAEMASTKAMADIRGALNGFFGGPLGRAAGPMDGVDDENQIEKLKSEAENIFENTRLPTEKLHAQFQKLKELMNNNLISPDTFNRAIKQALEGMSAKDINMFMNQLGLTGMDLEEPTKFKTSAGLSLRTAEGQRQAFSSIVSAKGSQIEGDSQKAIKANTDKMVTHLRNIATQGAKKEPDIAVANF